jgi:transcription termination/antitermination protein NusA
MNKDLIAIFEYLEREKGITREIVIDAIEESLRAAARKSISGAANVTVKIHPKTGNIEVYCEKEIVDEVEVPAQEISLVDARLIDPDCQLGQFIDIEATPKDFGRIAAQKARQIISQKLRSAERNVIYEEYRHRANEIISGTVKRMVRGANIIVDLGKVEAIMPMKHYPKTESYHPGDKVVALLLGVQDTETGGAEVILSRSHPEFVRQLMIQEVPEINDGTVIIDKVVREAGYRTKLTVRSTDSKVDPVGACVGMRGVRVKNVVRELNNEKIDIIPFAQDPVELLQNALSPIEIRKINVNEEERVISIVVDDDDFAAVIGKKGMNARLNGQLIGFELEVQKINDYNRLMQLQMNELAAADDPTLDEPLRSIEGVSKLVVEHLAAEGFTMRSLMTASREQLAAIPGISLEIADKILEQVRKQRKESVGQTSEINHQKHPNRGSNSAGEFEGQASEEEEQR